VRAEVAELTGQAKRAHVTINGIDPRALSGPPTVDPAFNSPLPITAGLSWRPPLGK
jgi:hypothetical protein